MKLINDEGYTLKHTILVNIRDAMMMASGALVMASMIVELVLLWVSGDVILDGVIIASLALGTALGCAQALVDDMASNEFSRYIKSKKVITMKNYTTHTTHTNDAGETYYSGTDENGQTVYSFSPEFDDVWNQEDQDAIDEGSTPSKF